MIGREVRKRAVRPLSRKIVRERPLPFFMASPFLGVFFAGIAMLFQGCGLTARDAITYHTFHYPAPSRDVPTPALGTLMIYRFLLDPSVETGFLVVARPKGKARWLTYQRWAHNPADMITDLVQRDIADAGLFSKTVGQSSNDRYRYALEATVQQLGGKVSQGKSYAVVQVHATLTDFGAPMGIDKTLMERDYRIAKPCKDSSPEGIIDGLNRAVKELSMRLRSDIRATLKANGRIPAEARGVSDDVVRTGDKGKRSRDKSSPDFPAPKSSPQPTATYLIRYTSSPAGLFVPPVA
jgi:ABC-type uncharacterized transport system auxiliary subunit